MACRDSGLPHDARNVMGNSGNVFERLPAREGPPSALFDNSTNFASSSRGLGPGNARTIMEHERGVRRERQSSSIPTPRCNQGIGNLFHNGVMDYLRFPISEMHPGKCPGSMEFFEAGQSSSRLKYVLNQQIFISQCTGSKQLI